VWTSCFPHFGGVEGATCKAHHHDITIRSRLESRPKTKVCTLLTLEHLRVMSTNKCHQFASCSWLQHGEMRVSASLTSATLLLASASAFPLLRKNARGALSTGLADLLHLVSKIARPKDMPHAQVDESYLFQKTAWEKNFQA
jgi:hypothetical protein